MSQKFKFIVLFHLLVSLIFISSPAHAQDKDAEGIDTGFENAMENDVGGYPSLNPAIMASYSQSYLYFYNTTNSSSSYLNRGYGVVLRKRKQGFRLSKENFFTNSSESTLELVGYGYRLTKRFFGGFNLSQFESKNVSAGLPLRYQVRGIDVGLLYAPSEKCKIDFSVTNIYSESKQNLGTWKKSVSALSRLRLQYAFLKNNALMLGTEFDFPSVMLQ